VPRRLNYLNSVYTVKRRAVPVGVRAFELELLLALFGNFELGTQNWSERSACDWVPHGNVNVQRHERSKNEV
jgi:hypothetical protein